MVAPVVVAEQPLETTAPVESLIEGAKPEGVEKTADAPTGAADESAKPEDVKADDKTLDGGVKVEASKPEPIQYEAFKLPDDFQAAPEQIEKFTGVLSGLGLSQEAGQKLMDLHGETLKNAVEQMRQAQVDEFAKTNARWVAEFEKQSGNRRDTLVNDAKWAISQLVPNAEKRKEIWSVMAFTGAGNHPAMINLMASVAKKLREPSAPQPSVPGNRGKGGSPEERRYGSNAR